MRFPDFDLQTDTGERLTLGALQGKTVVLYFYPKDDTSGCTLESCDFRDRFPRFVQRDAVILGISPDGVESHRKFKKKFALPFSLLVDEGHALAERLGLWVEKTFYGRKYMGVQRTTYIIGPDGAVQHVFEKVNPAGHADEVAAFLQDGVEAAAKARAAFDAAATLSEPAAKVPAKKKTKARKKVAAKRKPTVKKKVAARKPAAKKAAPKKKAPVKKKPVKKKPAASRKKPAAKK